MILYPYDRLMAVPVLTIDSALADSFECEVDTVGRSVWPVKLTEDNVDWSVITLECTLTCPTASRLDRFDSPLAAITATCSETNLRQVEMMQCSEDPNTWSSTIRLERDACRGKVKLATTIISSVDGVPRKIGGSDEWIVMVDDRKPKFIDGFLAIKWKSFADPDAPVEAHQYQGEPYALDLGGAYPVLYLNRDFEGLQRLFESSSKKDRAYRTLKENEFTSIGRAVWTALFNASLAAVLEDEDEMVDPMWPDSAWQRSVLESFLPLLYDGQRDIGALKQAVAARHDRLAMRDLQARLVQVVGRHVNAASALRRAIRSLDEEADVA